MNKFEQFRTVLLCGASLVAVGVLSGAALAQEQPMETVTVTGIRASLQSAQAIKQKSDQVVDSITAVDIGALPDRSVAEALQRVPGVQLTRTDALRDPVRYGGTGNGVFIRGLSWVSSLTNGRDTFSASNGRTLSFADISANLMAGVDVYKNPTAKMIEGGIGGTVDLRTRKPFDADGRVIAASADVTYGALVDAATPSVNVLVSDRWDTKIGEFGALFSADYQVQKNRTSSIYTQRYDVKVPVGTGSGYLPDSTIGWRTIDWTQARTAFDLSLQYRPNEKLEFTLTGIYSKAEPHEGEYAASLNVDSDAAYLPNYKFASDGTWVGGTMVNSLAVGNDTRVGSHHNTNADYSLTAKYNPTDALEITADLQYSESRAYFRSMAVFMNVINNRRTSSHADWDGNNKYVIWPSAPIISPKVDFSGDDPMISYTSTEASAVQNPKNNVFGAAMDHVENNYAHNWAGRLDATYRFQGKGLGGWLQSVEFGYRQENKNAITRQTGWNWDTLSYEDWFGGQDNMAAAVKYADDASMTKDMTLRNLGTILGNNVPSVWLVKASSLMGDTRDTAKLLATAKGTGGWTPYANQVGCQGVDYKCQKIYENNDPKADNVSGGINKQAEVTYAGYFVANFANDGFLGYDLPVDGNIGLRVIKTEVSYGAGYTFYPVIAACWDGAALCASNAAAAKFVGNISSDGTKGLGGKAITSSPGTHSYTNVLPSFNFRAHLSDQLQARVAYSQAMVRPDFSYTQNYTSLSFNWDSQHGGMFRANDPYTAGGGNPNLKPMSAQQYDASLEYYFSSTGSLSFAIFHKTLSNYFLTATAPESYAPNPNGGSGPNYIFQTTRTMNGGKGSVEGFEFAYQQFFDGLPGFWAGFGLQANYTKIYNHGGGNAVQNVNEEAQRNNHLQAGLPIEGMSNDSANLALLYAKYGVDFRLAYNWRSRYLMTSSAANINQPIWSRNFGQLDSSVFYDFLDHYKVGVQATNLLNTTTVLDVGYTDYHPRYDWIDTDRKISLIFRANW
ncbi:TonB-dependent receptor [Rhizomicrobium palustre]|uniref:TonB-dependent receptor n=1 Tax=Rhizomicrobium palustre TaxID=189966 RepID=A0A846N2E1_9PROT|nr:TonB-dependent receptor [Rhizomicrobium palustre]